MVTNNKERFWEILATIIPSLTYFGAFLYFCGRKYTESYYSCLGIPSNLLGFSIPDYMYAGSKPIQILFALIWTVLFVAFTRFIYLIFIKKIVYDSNKYTILQTIGIFGYFFLLLLAFIFLIISHGFQSTNNFNWSATFLLFSWIFISWGVMILFDMNLIYKAMRSKIMRYAFVILFSLTLFLLPFYEMDALGVVLSPRNISQSFGTIELTSTQPFVDNISWVQTDDGAYKTTDTLYLILSSNEQLFIRSDKYNNSLFVVPISMLSSYTLSTESNNSVIIP